MPRLQNELVYILMNRQPIRAERVTHPLLGPYLDTGCLPIFQPMLPKCRRREGRYTALKFSSSLVKCFDSCGSVWAQIDEPPPISLRDLGSNNDRWFFAVRQINISPL